MGTVNIFCVVGNNLTCKGCVNTGNILLAGKLKTQCNGASTPVTKHNNKSNNTEGNNIWAVTATVSSICWYGAVSDMLVYSRQKEYHVEESLWLEEVCGQTHTISSCTGNYTDQVWTLSPGQLLLPTYWQYSYIYCLWMSTAMFKSMFTTGSLLFVDSVDAPLDTTVDIWIHIYNYVWNKICYNVGDLHAARSYWSLPSTLDDQKCESHVGCIGWWLSSSANVCHPTLIRPH